VRFHAGYFGHWWYLQHEPLNQRRDEPLVEVRGFHIVLKIEAIAVELWYGRSRDYHAARVPLLDDVQCQQERFEERSFHPIIQR